MFKWGQTVYYFGSRAVYLGLGSGAYSNYAVIYFERAKPYDYMGQFEDYTHAVILTNLKTEP